MRRAGGLAALVLAGAVAGAEAEAEEARIAIDAAKVEGKIDPRLYGQFIEYMYEGIKGGLSAELLRNRGFEEAPNAIGLSRDWERTTASPRRMRFALGKRPSGRAAPFSCLCLRDPFRSSS